MFNGQELTGGKGTSTVYGTHVPLIINWPGSVLPNVSDALIDPSDFLPTLAALAKINEPANYGILDGIAFNALLTGVTERLRDWIYCYWNPENRDPIFRVWVQDEKYKYLFSVEAVNELANQGIPFRDAYQTVGNLINKGEFSFDQSKPLNHTHEGSLGNLNLAEIKSEMENVLKKF